MSERKIWRLLEVGEPIQKGDEYYCHSPDGWFKSNAIKVGEEHSPHRRLETIPTWPAPRDTKTDPPPDPCTNVMAFDLEHGMWNFYRQSTVAICPDKLPWWLPLPPAPTPPKSASEAAWELFRKELGIHDVAGNLRQIFVMGFKAGQKEATK